MKNRQTRSLVGGCTPSFIPRSFLYSSLRAGGTRQAPCDRSRIDPAQPDPHTRAPPLHSASRFFLLPSSAAAPTGAPDPETRPESPLRAISGPDSLRATGAPLKAGNFVHWN